ncbi:MAG: dipeptide/oligopeptide/nickel ABC transporter permease/ATP-binding protein [bacterium]
MKWRHALSPVHLAAISVLAVFVILAVIGPAVWGERAEEIDMAAISQGTSAAHPFGTDALGRDMLARTLVATQLSLSLAAAVTVLTFVFGIIMGAAPLLLGRRVMRWSASAIHLLVAFPSILLALLVITIVGIGTYGVVIALALAGAPHIARLTQTLAAQVAEADYVLAARGAGVRGPRLLVRHVAPNIAAPLALQFALGLGIALLALSALSFLGVGIQEPQYDWGALVDAGLERVYVTPVAALGPAAAIILVSLCFNVLGDALADLVSVDTPPSRVTTTRHRPAAAPASTSSGRPDAVLRVERLSVEFPTRDGTVTPVREIGFELAPGERLAIVGESGSGKSLTLLATAHLLESPAAVHSTTMELDGADLTRTRPAERDRRLATSMAMVFQDPLSSLNPSLRVGRQVTEAAEIHLAESRAEVDRRAAAWFEEFRIAGGAARLHQFPHEFSGGMRQRAVIAMGLMVRPRVILADEPTTALDVTMQRQALHALRMVNHQHGTGIVLVTHDIAVVEAFAERVLVMYAGRIVEELPATDLRSAAHPYTRDLIAAVPTMQTDRTRPLAEIDGHPPSVGDEGPGCAYAPRCRFATDRCRAESPALAPVASGRLVACWHPRVTDATEEPA